MDLLQEQIVSLSVKVDALHQMVEQLGNKTSEILTEFHHQGASSDARQFSWNTGRSAYSYRASQDPSMEHKDVLVDSNYPDSESQSGERALSPEIQIQRLTAQLTAAYNRIAALEEQLLAQRIH